MAVLEIIMTIMITGKSLTQIQILKIDVNIKNAPNFIDCCTVGLKSSGNPEGDIDINRGKQD